MATTPKTVTYEEWLEMPVRDDAIEEVVNGEIRTMPPTKTLHARVVHELTVSFALQLNKREVQIFGSQFGLVIRREPLSCRVPDLALFRKSGMIEQDGYIHSAPELVVEVLSPSNRRHERQEKLRDYEELGVPEVWVVSPEAQTVEVLQLEGGALKTRALVNQGTLHPLQFPEAAVEVSEIWP